MPAPAPALCALLTLAALTCARAEIYPSDEEATRTPVYRRSIQSTGVAAAGTSEVRGCMYSGRWFAEGGAVRVQDACLRCVCAHGALACARAACAPAPDPPPRRCALLHRRGACCPELHCPDGVKSLESEAPAGLEENAWDVATPAAAAHACAEEGGVFAAGSALRSRAACEVCFCLRGARRCVRPRCLPPPPACTPRPAPGACCPARYYCHAPAAPSAPSAPSSTAAPGQHDCEVDGEWVPEGERVSAAGAGNCTACFCLRGRVRCQPLACAPPLHGCTPLLRPGHCCPHQYRCPYPHHNHDSMASIIPAILDNALVSSRYDERSFRTSPSTRSATTTNTAPTSVLTAQTAAAPAAPAPTAKVKRKTNDPPPTTVSDEPSQNTTTTTPPVSTTTTNTEPTTTTDSTSSSTTEASTAAQPLEYTSTERPQGSVKIIINGTINCSAELSSTPMHATFVNDTEKIQLEANPRIPYGSGDGGIEAQTSSPADIITDRGVSAGFDDDDSFTINVTSSLRANMSRPLPAPPAPPAPPDSAPPLNISKKTKEDYDYDYAEPTLPPSLPNLKIIPFVAADAVVDEDVSSKDDSLTYPVLEREDKFPVYYPGAGAGAGAGVEHKAPPSPFATRREDVYSPTQYPVFVSAPGDVSGPPAPPGPATTQPAAPPPSTSSTRQQTMPTPAVNLFSPPVETEGGFVPKGPGIIDEYYAVYPSTPPPVPHLTTSMQINPTDTKSECVTSEGRRVPAGGSLWLGCAACRCEWGELTCVPRRCVAPPPHCRRAAPAPSRCCGDILCDHDNTTTPAPTLSTRRTEIALNVTEVPIEIESELIPFDPPPDRSVPATSDPTDIEKSSHEHKRTDEERLGITPAVQTAEGDASTTRGGEAIKEITTTKTTTITTTTPKSTTGSAATRVTAPAPTRSHEEGGDGGGQSQEYEDEEDDEGFSFGSVLKLLLSDSYDTTTASTNRKKPATTTVKRPAPTSTAATPAPASPPLVPFIPIQPHPFGPPKKFLPHNTVNRIDHLVLGEATAIKRTTARPGSTPPVRRPTARPSTRKPAQASSTRAAPSRPEPPQHTPAPAAAAGGLLKLAGCNIYGRMYRVGRIIAELSTPCQECRCTELGVQCTPLHC